MTQKPQQRRGLGRGLGSLIPTAPRVEESPAGPVEEHTEPDLTSGGTDEAAPVEEAQLRSVDGA